MQVLLGGASGERHEGPSIDFMIVLSVKTVALVELKLSLSAISAITGKNKDRFRSQVMMMGQRSADRSPCSGSRRTTSSSFPPGNGDEADQTPDRETVDAISD